MSLGLYDREDLEQGIKSTVIMAVTVYLANGARNTDHIAGILAHAQAQAALYGCPWTQIVEECKAELGAPVADLLDEAATLAVVEVRP